MASWFYAMMRILRQKDVLKSTIHSVMFQDLAKNDKVQGAVIDIENEVFLRPCISYCMLYSLQFVPWALQILTN